MGLKGVSRTVALLDGVSAALTFWGAVKMFGLGEQTENAGAGLMALALVCIATLMAAIAAMVLLVCQREAVGWLAKVVVLLIGLAPPAAVAPFALDEYRRSTTVLNLACSNLQRAEPRREVAIYDRGEYTYFALLSPWFAHAPDLRYRVASGYGKASEFRLQCRRDGPCTMKDQTEAELREAVARALPPCPAP